MTSPSNVTNTGQGVCPAAAASLGIGPAGGALVSGATIYRMATNNPFIDFVLRYQYDFRLLVVEVLGATPDEWQGEVLDAASRGERRMAVRSGHGVGKSTLAAWLLIAFVLTRYPSKSVVTAPTSQQLFDALFAEVKHWITKLPPDLQVLLDVKGDRIELKAAPDSAFISARTSRAEAPEALQGIHSENVLMIVDEASGVPEPVFEAAIGSMSTEGAMTLMLGNPTRTSGFFYDAFHGNSDSWWTKKVNCLDSTRVAPEFAKEVAQSYGEESNAYRVRVLGEFPRGDDDTIISLEVVENAEGRDIKIDPEAGRVWGLDCARFGDDASVLIRMHGRGIDADEPPIKMVKLNTMQVAGRIKQLWDEQPERRPKEINVDVIGIGAGVVDRLVEMGLPARGINVSENPAMKAKYKNQRTELWFLGKDWFEANNCSLPVYEKGSEEDKMMRLLKADLIGVKYSVADSTGAVAAEPKKDTKKRLRRSPDFADAFLLCLASQHVLVTHGSSAAGSSWNRPLRRNLSMP